MVRCLIAYTKGTIASIDHALERRSSLPGCGFFDSGSTHAPRPTMTSITGTLIRNTLPHQKCSSRAPPTTGPSAMPLAAAADQIAIARVRSAGSVKMFRMSESVDGISVEPATPSSSRATMSISGLGANAAATEAMPNAVAPISSSRLRPTRSAMLPMVMSRPAIASEYTSPIHSTAVALASRSLASDGTARCSTVASIASSSTAPVRTPRLR